jgi:hypothetical protein
MVAVISNILGTNGKNGTETQFYNGLLTLKATPGVKDSRVNANKVRQAE